MWRSFPPDILIKTILVPGGAFRMAYAFRDGEPEKYRYFFVLNKSPESSEVILVSTATTQVEKRKRARGPDVLVYIGPSDYPPMERDSVIDCASITSWQRDKFIDNIRLKEVEPLERLPEAVLVKIRTAVSCASTLPPYMKRMILPDEGE